MKTECHQRVSTLNKPFDIAIISRTHIE